MPTVRASALAIVALLPFPAAAADKVDYGRDIRPILSNHCFKCHGPATQKAKLRLDGRDHATKSAAVVPGKPADSEILKRITAAANDDRMPPPEAGERLSPDQVKKLTAWIEQGAEYAPHWAFVPPKRPAPPHGPAQPVPDPRNGRGVGREHVHPIDAFVAKKLSDNRLSLSPPADRATLIRRVTLDLTGLLPTPKEVDEFLADTSAGAFEKVVDRLLASPHYGERQARHWLDLARYADSNGYTIDGPRSIWPYRDWVIKALNDDMPFDQFTTLQLAGDMPARAAGKDEPGWAGLAAFARRLPPPSARVATGFHRNTSFNEEGGTDPEQFRVERVVDRTNTTGAVWLGLTVGCAQCHDHKYDAFSQKDYYRLYAFFNSCDEPTLPLGGSPEVADKIAELQARAVESRRAGDDAETKRLEAEIKKTSGQIPTTLVLRERAAPRKTFVQVRGDFLRHGDEVAPGYPSAIGADDGRKLDRRDLAKWLVSGDNPLTARVVVNREWQKFFGVGLVETENDFGMQGTPPTHPELLDWLAVEFVTPDAGTAWSLKRLHKLIVTSATYQQSSASRKELADRDPRNLLLGRQARVRLEAEVIRDAALAASGLFNPKVGGPGVFPPQPKEVFSFTQSQRKWDESKGPDRYRRGMYTYIWRQSQHPLMTTFDAADAQTSCTKRNRSNTPLQALHLANDPVFVELADGLGKRIEKEGPADAAGRVAFAFRVCFARPPSAGEAARVLAYYEARAKADPKTAWAAVARVLLNLDEFITRE